MLCLSSCSDYVVLEAKSWEDRDPALLHPELTLVALFALKAAAVRWHLKAADPTTSRLNYNEDVSPMVR